MRDEIIEACRSLISLLLKMGGKYNHAGNKYRISAKMYKYHGTGL